MKPKASLRFLLVCPIIALLAAPPLQALTYYWDNNGTTSGFGTAAGTWAAPTTGSATQGWSTSATGVLLPGSVTTATTDTVNFGNGATGLGSGSITVSGTVSTGNMTFASGSGAITLTGGKIILGGGRTITSNNTGNVISSELELTGNSTVSLAFPGGGTPASSSITFGVISGTGNMTFQNTAGANPNPARFILNGASSYSGSTLLTSTNTNANIALSIGVDNALPTTTVLTLDGGDGTGSGRTANFELNGNDQILAGLTNTSVLLRTHNVLNTSATLSTLTINDSGNRAFSGRIGTGGTNIAIVKQGAGTWTLSGANTYEGTTTISGGVINIRNATALGGTTNGTSVAAGAALQIQNNITVASEALTLNGTGITDTGALRNISGTNNYNGAIILGGDSRINSDSGTLNLGGGITGTGFGLTVGGAGTTTISTTGINTGTGGTLTKDGAGTLTLNVASDYTGLTTVSAGALRIQNTGALGTTAAGSVVNGSATPAAGNARIELDGGITVTGESITLNGGGNFNGALTSSSGNNVWAGAVTIGSVDTRIGALANATLEVSGTIDSGAVSTGLNIRTANVTDSTVILSGVNTYLGATRLIVGKLQLAGGDNRLPVGTTLSLTAANLTNTTEFDLNGFNQEVAGLSLGSGSAAFNSVNNSSLTDSTLTVNTAAPSTYGGILKGNLALTKTGSNSLTLAGVNAYTDATTVSAGKLFVNGDQSAATGAVGVAADATLGGTGIIGGDVTIAGNGRLEFNLNTPAAGHDKLELAAGKALNLAGASTLTITSAGGASTGPYTLVSAPGGIFGSVPAVILPAGWTADPPVISGGTNLVINITDTGAVTYASWSGGAAADADSNNDGVLNGVAWALGAANVNENAIGLLPDFDNTTDPAYALFTFQRSDDAEADPNTTIRVEYGNNLTGWTTAVHDGDNVIIIVDDQSPNDDVTVKLKRSTLAPGGKLFARLNVVVTP